MATAKPKTIDAYIAGCAPEVRPILEKIRTTIRRAAPEAMEGISYDIPIFSANGTLTFFAAFKHHIGLYPPVRGDAALEKAVAPYAGEKGNLRFPLDRPIPYGLITRIVKLRLRQNRARAKAKAKAKAKPARSRAARGTATGRGTRPTRTSSRTASTRGSARTSRRQRAR